MGAAGRLVGDAIDEAHATALLLAIGSTLSVYPICDVVPIAKRLGAALVIVNAEPTQFDDLADALVRDPISHALPAIIGPGTPAGG